MKIERDFHMTNGDDEFSYAKNSMMQRKAILAAKPTVKEAISKVCTDLHPQSMVISDLGCSFGANTLLFVSDAITTIGENPNNTIGERPKEIQFFLNDLPGNDFNNIFQSLEQFEQSTTKNCTSRGLQPPPHYVVGLPGSFYTRLFPCNNVHLFHSSMSLMWLSQDPENLDGIMNEANIHIGLTTPPLVTKLYQNQFKKDFSRFLKMRCKEIVPGGRMVLTMLGRNSTDVFSAGGTTMAFELLSQGLQTLVAEDCVEKEKLDSFNLPLYCPSVDELKELVWQNELLDITDIRLFEINGNPNGGSDQSAEDAAAAPVIIHGAAAAEAAGKTISTSLRAVKEPLIASHFGESILDKLFAVFARYFTNCIESEVEKSPVPVITLSLQPKH
ncbi:anthranilate O-methyltransferase 1-like [Oryza glaberrima]|uniref:anthranilate O-methyltransferase 1-like n=1 Tax=Oryza glaberrima TaxID=4538 RepID=UPI00023DF730|nr:anthranilate O-methyltransferase 1-like [Oryza glaberrima]